MAAAKKATARSVSLPVFSTSWRIGVGCTNAARSDRDYGAVLDIALTRAGNDVLRLFGRVGVPAKPLARFDLVDDDRGCRRAVAAIDGEGAFPMHRRVSLAPDFSTLQFGRVDRESLVSGWHGALLRFCCGAMLPRQLGMSDVVNWQNSS